MRRNEGDLVCFHRLSIMNVQSVEIRNKKDNQDVDGYVAIDWKRLFLAVDEKDNYARGIGVRIDWIAFKSPEKNAREKCTRKTPRGKTLLFSISFCHFVSFCTQRQGV